MPEWRGGILTRKDFGSGQGVIEHDLPFKVRNLPPYQQHSINNGASTLSYIVDSIELSPTGSDTQTDDQIREMLQRLESAEPREAAPAGITSEKDERRAAET